MVCDEEDNKASNDEEHDNEHQEGRPPRKPIIVLLWSCTF